jgi:site-specific recombinase XerD
MKSKTGLYTLRVRRRNNRFRLVTKRGIVLKEAGRFLSAIEMRGLSPQTVRAYAFDLLILYRWLNSRKDTETRIVEALKQSDLVEFIRFQQEANASPTSINRRLLVASLLYRFVTGASIEEGGVLGVSLPSPCYKGRGKDRELGLQKIRAPLHRALRVKVSRTLVEPLTAEQARLLIGSFTRYRDIAIAYLMLLCGLRSREVIAISVMDVSFDEQRLIVTGKGGNERVLPLPGLLLKYLHNYLRLERPTVCRSHAFLRFSQF